jgi:hypothetical protein
MKRRARARKAVGDSSPQWGQRSPAWGLGAIAAITVLAAVLRFRNLGAAPLWIDEALLAAMAQGHATVRQEFPYVWTLRVFERVVTLDEFSLRFMAALLGTLTVPAFYWMLRRQSYALPLSLFIATFPLFVFWSRMARPYAFAGFFVVLGWKYWPSHLLAILTTPTAIIATIDWGSIRHRKSLVRYAILVAASAGVLFLRPDVGKGGFDWRIVIDAPRQWPRLWYIPCISDLFHLGKYGFPWLRDRNLTRRARLV